MTLIKAESVISCAKDQAVWPWHAEPYRLWSLHDMLLFYAGVFAEAASTLDSAISSLAIETLSHGDDESKTRVEQKIKDMLSAFGATLQREQLPLSQTFYAKISRTIENVNLSKDHFLVTHSLIIELKLDMVHELKEHMFLGVRPDRRRHYHDNGCTFGTIVESAFPDTTSEVKSANRCFALEEWTACVFHLMRALEIALHKWAKDLGVVQFSAIELENWKNILDAADKKIKALEQQPKSASKDAELQYYGETTAHYRSVKDAWRNHVAHARTTYDEGQASSIINHVREFMVLLAARP